MDQDTSNNPGKTSWREKLGLGTTAKDMPKISNEFKAARTDLNAEPKRGKPQPVARPAPMAPRPQPAAQSRPQSGGPLAERLKAQRAAAEKLAEQRILTARASSEAKSSEKPKPPSDKPKFTFAEEEIAQAKREAPVEEKREYQSAFSAKPVANGGAKAPQAGAPANNPPPLVPPRPALGGERPIAPPQPAEGRQPPGPSFPPRFQNAVQPVGYRPLDPPPGGLQGRQQQAAAQPPRPAPAGGYGNGSLPEIRGAQPRGHDPYRRRPSHEPGSPEEGHVSGRPRRSAPLPARGRPPAYEDDMSDVFAEETPPRRRASAQDYHQAYRDFDEGYDHEERRRSSGPWLILLALIIVGAVAAGGWYYWYYMKPAQVTSTEVPVVTAPENPSKTGPEPIQPSGSTLGSSNNQGALETSPDRRKQIYDRVLGEESIEGNQIVPTQELPQRVEPAGEQAQQPLQGTLPQLNTQGNSSADTSEATDPLPLPLPPPPGSSSDQQGDLNATSSEPTESAGLPDVSSQPIAQPASADDVIAPIPGEANKEAAKTVNPAQPAPPPVEKPAEQPVQNAEVKPVDPPPIQAAEPAPVTPKPQVVQTETKKAASNDVEEIAGPEPMILAPQGGASQAANEPPAVPDQISPSEAQPENKSGSFFNFQGSSGKKRLTGKRADQPDFSNSNLLNSGPKPLTGETSDPQDQLASVSSGDQPEPQPLPMPAPEATETTAQSSGGGYIAQLASFRSEAEAMAEYDRLRTKHGNVMGGLAPRVTKANVSGGTRYRLGVGPVASRDAASRICNSLIAAGERDCLVRGN